MRRFALSLWVLAVLCVSACAPQNVAPVSIVPPPKIPEDLFANTHPTVRNRLALHFALGEFSGSFEKTTLDAVHKATGGGVIQHQGDAGESMYWLCYNLPSALPPQRVWILSSGEMGGRDHEVTQIDAETFLQRSEPDSGCPDLPDNMLSVSVDNGVMLGMEKQAVFGVLGKPSKTAKGWLLYLHERKVGHGLDEASWLAVHFKNDKTDIIRAGKVTTN